MTQDDLCHHESSPFAGDSFCWVSEVAPRQDSQSAEALTSRFSFDMCSKRLMATSVSTTAHLIAYVWSPITESPLAKRSPNARLVGPIVQMAHQ